MVLTPGAEMYAPVADASLVVQLDGIYVLLTMLTLLHAASNRGLWPVYFGLSP